MGTLHKLPPPRRAGLYDPLVNGATLADIDRALEQERHKAKLLADAGYRLTIGEQIVDAFEGSFVAGFVCGAVTWSMLIAAPFLIGWLK